jgi:hypothetical protein
VRDPLGRSVYATAAPFPGSARFVQWKLRFDAFLDLGKGKVEFTPPARGPNRSDCGAKRENVTSDTDEFFCEQGRQTIYRRAKRGSSSAYGAQHQDQFSLNPSFDRRILIIASDCML